MKISNLLSKFLMMTNCSFNWQDIYKVLGPCLRPGGLDLTERALEFCRLRPGSIIADIGCGAGGTLQHLEGIGIYRIVGLDCSGVFLREVMSLLASPNLVHGQAEILPFRKGSFDAVFCECVLSILCGRLAALRECARIVKEDGFLVVSDVFDRAGTSQGQQGLKSVGLGTREILKRREVFTLLMKAGFLPFLWEEHQNALKEFLARMILAGFSLPGQWRRTLEVDSKKTDQQNISYFLLVARKAENVFPLVENKGDSQSWMI